MPRPKGSKNKIQEKKICIKCNKNKLLKDFYKSNSPLFDGLSPVCKQCIAKFVDEDNLETVYQMLQQLDIKFDPVYWERAKSSGGSVFGNYIRMANSLPQFQGTGWKDSEFDKDESKTENEDNNQITENTSVFNPKKFKPTNEILEKWGYGYSPEEYYYFEKKYQQLKNNYPEKTALHTEALLTYIRYRVKEELATAEGNYKEAKEWGNLAKDAAQAAKINPSQLSKADLSDGLDTFGQLVRAVEQAVDIIPILPKFKERPQDKVDFTIWCYINYIRDLKGLPLVEYEEIYKFYEDRKKEYENRFDFLKEEAE